MDNTTILKVLEKFSKTIKDFAIEQSGLNNLVNVEFIPSDNNTTYTGNSVDYLGTLKLTLSDNIIVNKPCNIKFNIKGSNTIVVDVDEFNNSLELHLDNSVVTTLDFAESERQKSATDGAIVHDNELLNKVYPIGSIYLSVNSTSPASIFGGTWEKIQDKFLLGSGSYSLGSEGGSTSHNHSLNNGFAKIGYTWASETENSLYLKYKPVNFISTLQTSNDIGYQTAETQRDGATELGGTTDNTEILPPYLVVNIWKRIA